MFQRHTAALKYRISQGSALTSNCKAAFLWTSYPSPGLVEFSQEVMMRRRGHMIRDDWKTKTSIPEVWGETFDLLLVNFMMLTESLINISWCCWTETDYTTPILGLRSILYLVCEFSFTLHVRVNNVWVNNVWDDDKDLSGSELLTCRCARVLILITCSGWVAKCKMEDVTKYPMSSFDQISTL